MRRIIVFLALCALAFSALAGMNRWTETSPAGGTVHGIVFDPDAPSIVYAGTTAGVFKSWNGGQQWYWMSRGFGGTSAHGMVFDQASPCGLYVTGDHGVYKSIDRGMTWSLIYDSIGDLIVVNPNNPSIIYVAGPGPVRKTIDGGAHWSPASTGMSSGSVTTPACRGVRSTCSPSAATTSRPSPSIRRTPRACISARTSTASGSTAASCASST